MAVFVSEPSPLVRPEIEKSANDSTREVIITVETNKRKRISSDNRAKPALNPSRFLRNARTHALMQGSPSSTAITSSAVFHFREGGAGVERRVYRQIVQRPPAFSATWDQSVTSIVDSGGQDPPLRILAWETKGNTPRPPLEGAKPCLVAKQGILI